MSYYYHDPFYPTRKAIQGLVDEIYSFFSWFIPMILLIIAVVLILRVYFKYRRSGLRIGLEGHIQGIIFGRLRRRIASLPRLRVYSPVFKEGHVGIWGGSGVGKTSALLIPTLRSFVARSIVKVSLLAGSLCIDISGDISSNVDISNKVVFDPLDPNTIPYDVFALIDILPTDDQKREALSKLAYLIIPERHSDSAAANYYASGSRNILIASLIAFYFQGWDFVRICRHIVESSQPDLFSEIDATKNENAIMYINGFVRPDGSVDSNVAGCKESCNTAVILFATNTSVANALRRPAQGEASITPESLETNHVFLRIEEDFIDLFGPLMRIIVAQCAQYLSSRPLDADRVIGMYLDEFKALGTIGDFPGYMARLRKRGVRIVLLTQALSDIESIYSRSERRSMLNNMKYIVLLEVRDVDEQEYFARMIGKHKVRQVSRRGLLGFKDITISKREEYIINPSDLANLGDRLILLYPGGHIKLWKNYYFK